MTTTTVDVDQLTEIPRHTVTIDAAALRTVLHAVIPHTDSTEDQPAIHRVRLDVGDGQVEALATSRYTCAIARIEDDALVDTAEHGDPQWTVDLYPEDLTAVAKMFKPGKDEQITLRIDLRRDDRVTFTDASGLFDGRAYTIPSVGHPEDFPNIRDVIASTMQAKRGVVGTVTYTGDLLRRFAASAAAYNDALHIEPTAESKPFVVTIAQDFIGLLMPRRNDESTSEEQQRVNVAWKDRLMRD